MNPLPDSVTQVLAVNWQIMLGAASWGLVSALLAWAGYRLVLNRVLRLIYSAVDLPAEEHARRLGIPALILAILIGTKVALALLPGAPFALVRGTDVAFWIFLTVFCIRILESLIIDCYLVVYREVRLPRLLRDIVKFLVYLTIFTTLFHSLYNLNIAPLLTTSAVFTMVIGLALQDTLGNLFAGLATSIDQPYQMENWITVDSNVRGRVIAITWRSTTIENWKGDKISIPNNVLSKTRVMIHRWPLGYHKDEFFLRISTLVPADQVRQLLFEAVRDIPYVEKTPAPSLEFGDFGDGFMTYILGVWVKDGTYPPVRTEVPIRLWYRLAREGLAIGSSIWGGEPAPPRPEGGAVDTAEEIRQVLQILKQVDFLSSLPEQELKHLGMRLHIERYATGEYLFRQGDLSSTFYVILRGKVGVMVRQDGMEEMVQVATLEEGAYFGEMSLLTGAPRSANVQALTETEVVAMTREDFESLLELDPTVPESISRVIAERNVRTKQELAARQTDAAEQRDTDAQSETQKEHSALLNSIRSFFKLT